MKHAQYLTILARSLDTYVEKISTYLKKCLRSTEYALIAYAKCVRNASNTEKFLAVISGVPRNFVQGGFNKFS
jgi:hypothetical protein